MFMMDSVTISKSRRQVCSNTSMSRFASSVSSSPTYGFSTDGSPWTSAVEMTGVETSYLAETSSEHNPLSKVDNMQLQSGCIHCTSDRATNQDVTVFHRKFLENGWSGALTAVPRKTYRVDSAGHTPCPNIATM